MPARIKDRNTAKTSRTRDIPNTPSFITRREQRSSVRNLFAARGNKQ